jgi:hypothetical protein
MKLETVDKIITEFVGLRSKMYSLKIQDDTDKNAAKGVKKSIKDNIITHTDYLNTLMTCTHKPVTQNSIRSFNLNVFSIQQTKIGLSPVNDKKYLLQDGTSGYSYGHTKIGLSPVNDKKYLLQDGTSGYSYGHTKILH